MLLGAFRNHNLRGAHSSESQKQAERAVVKILDQEEGGFVLITVCSCASYFTSLSLFPFY